LFSKDDLFAYFWQTAKDQSAIHLLNIYKGLPITNDANIIGMDGAAIRVSTTKYQIVCLYVERGAYIQGDDLENVIRCDVTGLNLQKQEAVLSNFQLIQEDIGKRDQIRVKPDPPLRGGLQIKNAVSAVDVNVTDVSMSGLGVYLDRYAFHPRLYAQNQDVNVILYMPGTGIQLPQTSQLTPLSKDPVDRFSRERLWGLNTSDVSELNNPSRQQRPVQSQNGEVRLTVRGKVMNMHPELHLNQYRLGIRLIHEDSTRMIFTQFVSQRQSELIREIKVMYELLTKIDR
jgi:hypothetical protein